MLLLDDGGSGCQALSADPSAFPPPLRAAARDLWLLSSDSANASRVRGRLTRSLYTGGAGSKRTASGNRPLFGELVQKTSPPRRPRSGFTCGVHTCPPPALAAGAGTSEVGVSGASSLNGAALVNTRTAHSSFSKPPTLLPPRPSPSPVRLARRGSSAPSN